MGRGDSLAKLVSRSRLFHQLKGFISQSRREARITAYPSNPARLAPFGLETSELGLSWDCRKFVIVESKYCEIDYPRALACASKTWFPDV
jgi:hypothetical protein